MLLLFLPVLPLVAAHGGVLWPPSWQDSKGVPLENITSFMVHASPEVKDPKIPGKRIRNIKRWLTDNAYLGGVGEEYKGVGNATNPECPESEKCGRDKTPWAAPGQAVSLGGGCGVFGGNPHGCYSNDTRPPGSICGGKGTFMGGSDAREVEFPNKLTTVWEVGSREEVAWVGKGYHKGGYTYRLCKIPPEGKGGLTEECFARTVLRFATDYTMIRPIETPGDWVRVDQTDLTTGTYPPGSAWRHVAKIRWNNGDGYLRKDLVDIPADLPLGDYVLGFRWDTKDPQIWVSCSNIRLVSKQ